ncbi:DUF1474 family protein [Mammaliicoccus sciuri]|uniref:type II toxin-antitoxin system toxin TscT n=1 Tax=Mammaliicoccus sciuri TaxID=1296 RepID=UPI0018DD1C4B|nr:DUF1474 family protein [Mammaliicoccus sciuri]QPW14143.1 DUF1474 family protein [Mammaliicoccus sciuri]
MKNNLFNIENLKCDMEVLQGRIADLIQSDYWLLEEHFEAERLGNQDDLMNHGLAYIEQRIRLNQSLTLLQTYKKEMDNLLSELNTELGKLKGGE